MKHRKRQRPRITKAKEAAGFQNPRIRQIDDQSGVSNGLSEGIAALSMQEGVAAAEMIENLTETTSSSSVRQGDDPAESFGHLTETVSNCDGYRHRNGGKVSKGRRGNKVIAATGIVSTVLGKDYVRTSNKGRGVPKSKIIADRGASQEIAKNSCDVLANCGSRNPSGPKTSTQEVLESLFNPKPEANSMNRRNVVKEHIPGKGDDYQNHMNTKTQHSDSMKDATAYASGRQECAPDLSESSSHDPWYIGFKNVIPFHLCRQKVKFGLEIVMDHLGFAAGVGNVHAYRVTTGCESHGLGGSTELKHAIVGLLEALDIEWEEENRTTLLIKMNGFSLSDSGSDSE